MMETTTSVDNGGEKLRSPANASESKNSTGRPPSSSSSRRQRQQELGEELDLRPSGVEITAEARSPNQRLDLQRKRSLSQPYAVTQERQQQSKPQTHEPLACQDSRRTAESTSANLNTNRSFYIVHQATTPVSRTGRPACHDGPFATKSRQRRGSRFEKTSLKLNRLFESSLSMLPQPELAHTTTSQHSTAGPLKGRTNHWPCWPNKTHLDQPTIRVVATNQQKQQQMLNGDLKRALHLQPHQEQRRHEEQWRLGRHHSLHVKTIRRRAHAGRKQNDDDDDDDDDIDGDKDIDGGYAWIILVVMFVINASTFGTARAYGLIFDKLARVDEQSRAEAALPFTIMGAIENMAGPLSGCLLARTSSWRLTVFAGSCLVTVAHLFAALFANSQVSQLLAMGLMCGLGMSFVSISFFQVNNAYFVRYRNRAFGVGMTGAAFGTLYISPLCQYFLDNYEGTGMCYLMLCLIVAPNVPLSLLLKPKRNKTTPSSNQSFSSNTSNELSERAQPAQQMKTISEQVERRQLESYPGLLVSIKMVVLNPIFHLIWPTQLLFCWFNFVFGMIIVDFGKDRGLNTRDVSHLIPIWAFGQLIGRLILSTLVDLKFLSYRSFTIICFGAIGITTYILNNTRLKDSEQPQATNEVHSLLNLQSTATRQHLIILTLILVLSMFIALLYILLNGLIVNYVEKSLQPLSIGISSFTGSFFLLPRAYVIGYYRDIIGNYDAMLTMFTVVSLCAALTWLLIPTACRYLRKLYDNIKNGGRVTYRKRNVLSIMTPCTTWKLAAGRS